MKLAVLNLLFIVPAFVGLYWLGAPVSVYLALYLIFNSSAAALLFIQMV